MMLHTTIWFLVSKLKKFWNVFDSKSVYEIWDLYNNKHFNSFIE